MQDSGKEHRKEIAAGEKGLGVEIRLASQSLNDIAPNSTMIKLYAMSKTTQEYGKKRREQIVHAKAEINVMKV